MKALKIIFSLLALVLVICIFAIGCMIYFVDPEKLKPVLIEEVKNETGYQLTIDGKLGWSLYPRLAVKADHIQLKKPGEAGVFLDAKGVHIATDLIGLLRNRETLNGIIVVNNLQFKNIKTEKMSANVLLKNKLVILKAIKGSLYGGSMQGEIRGVDISSAPVWEWDMQFNQLQLKPLLQDLETTETKMKIAGIGSVSLQGQTRGKTREELLRQLNGRSIFSVEQGILEGIDINYFLQLADAALHKQPVDQLVNTKQTSFTHLSGSAQIQNGIAKSNDLLLTAPTFVTRAQGTYELVSTSLDYELKIKPQLENTKLKWDIPVLITGDLHQPEVKLDFMEIQKMVAGMEIENLKKKAAAEIQKHIPGKTGEFLQNLLGQ